MSCGMGKAVRDRDVRRFGFRLVGPAGTRLFGRSRGDVENGCGEGAKGKHVGERRLR